MTSVVPPTAHTNAVKSPVFTCNLCVKNNDFRRLFSWDVPKRSQISSPLGGKSYLKGDGAKASV